MTEDTGKRQADGADMFTEWMKKMSGTWEQAQRWSQMMQTPPGGFPGMSDAGAASEATKAFMSGGKIAMAMASKLGEPENVDAFLKSMSTMPEISQYMSKQIADTYLEMQKMWSEHLSKFDQHKKAYNFDGIDENFFRMLRDVYDKEFRRYFNVPTLGLNRFQQERRNRFMDEMNKLQLALSEFLYLFSVPIEKSSQVMREKTEEMVEKGELPENFKDYYNMWVKILEGHYMTLLQSPEYVQAMAKAIEALVNFNKAKSDVLEDMLEGLPVATSKEMDDLSREFYELKRKVRDLSKRMDQRKTADSESA